MDYHTIIWYTLTRAVIIVLLHRHEICFDRELLINSICVVVKLLELIYLLTINVFFDGICDYINTVCVDRD